MTNAPRIGDRIYLDFGALAGSDLATVVGVQPADKWGPAQLWVRRSDFSLTTTTLAGLGAPVRGRIATDYQGEEFFSPSERVPGIGAYPVALVD